MGIFKAYDIRGVVPDELGAEDAYRIGRAVAQHLRVREIAVGWDVRESSPRLRAELIRGITEEGVDVAALGEVATPMMYCAVERLGTGGGVMVTASHNPAQYNGFKICAAHAVPIGEASGLREIEKLAGAVEDGAVTGTRTGRVRDVEIVDDYVEHLLGVAHPEAPLRVAIDCGNGMAAAGLVPLLERLKIQVEPLYFEPDGSFPNHPADPLRVENLADLRAAVTRVGAAVGVAFDGDADRAIFVDELGEPVSSDLVTALLATERLRDEPGGRVLYDLRSSRATAEAIEAAGGVAEMCRVGHSFVKARMRESGAIFGGELSGHYYFRFSDTLIADDGLAAFVALLDLLGTGDVPLSERVAPLRRYAASGEISRRIADPPGFLEAVERDHTGEAEISHLDGLLVRYPDWWFNLRASNTEPVVRLNLEAGTPEKMSEERDRLVARMEASAS